MANFFEDRTLAELAKIVRGVQSGANPIGPGIEKQLRERCWLLTDGKDRAAYAASLTDPELKASSFSDWMAVEYYGKGYKK
jgi:hypothetical protein